MEAIILAGGLGTRLRQVISDVPKPMAPIAGRPFLEILLDKLAHNGFHRIILSLGFMAERIIKHFGSSFAGMKLVYVTEDIPLGTGGALRLAMTVCTKDHVFVFNGDTYLDLETALTESQWQTDKRLIVVAREVSDTERYGRLIIDGRRIVTFTEKGVSGHGLINAGCYVFPTNALDLFPLNKSFSIETDYLIAEISNGMVDVFVTKGLFIDIGIPEDYAKAQDILTDL
jgi:D-glycero-alpha-D-manno-heptose 1-phosphate guanylyltransferase